MSKNCTSCNGWGVMYSDGRGEYWSQDQIDAKYSWNEQRRLYEAGMFFDCPCTKCNRKQKSVK